MSLWPGRRKPRRWRPPRNWRSRSGALRTDFARRSWELQTTWYGDELAITRACMSPSGVPF